MVPIVSGADLINIHEWAWLRSKSFKCLYLGNHVSDPLPTCFGDIIGSGTSSHAMTLSYLINIHEWAGLRTETSKFLVNTILKWKTQCQIGLKLGYWITLSG